jgi:hypothetical protein
MIWGKELGLEFNDCSAIRAIADHAEIPAFDKLYVTNPDILRKLDNLYSLDEEVDNVSQVRRG